MAFISEIHYRTADVEVSDSTTHEFVEITLGPDDDPADFVVSFYGNDGALMDDAGDNIQATGVANGEVRLSDLVGVPDPDNPDFTIYTITATSPDRELINATPSQVADEANYVALTNTSTGVVDDAIGIGSNGPTTLTGGAADGATTTNAPTVGPGESVQFDEEGNNVSGPRTPGNSDVPCFTAGTYITVPGGLRLVEDLAVGDEVITLNHGPQPIRWVGRRHLSVAQLNANPKLKPIRIRNGSLGNGLPNRDLLVSRQHRMLASSRISMRMFGDTLSLIAAINLTQLSEVSVVTKPRDVMYFHLMFDQHEIIFAEGAPTESLFLGAQALEALGAQSREEILTLFPEVARADFRPRPAAHLPVQKRQKKLAARHIKNGVPLLDTDWQHT